MTRALTEDESWQQAKAGEQALALQTRLDQLAERAQQLGLTQVTQQTFFEKMGPLNVHPTPTGSWERGVGYVTEWKLQINWYPIIGLSWGEPERFYWIKA